MENFRKYKKDKTHLSTDLKQAYEQYPQAIDKLHNEEVWYAE